MHLLYKNSACSASAAQPKSFQYSLKMSSRLSTERGEKRPHSPQGNATQPAGKHTALVPNAVVTHHHATQCSRLSQEHAIAQEHAMGYVQPAEERNEVDNEPDSKPDNVEEEETGNERENDTGTPFGETLVRTLDPSRDLEDLIQDLALLRVEAPEKEIFTDADLKSFVRESVGLIRRKQWKGESAKFTTIDFVRPQKLPFVMYGSFLSEAQTQTWKDWAEGEGNEIALFISSVDFTICTLARADALVSLCLVIPHESFRSMHV